jgi:Fe-S-cluster containining protein
MSQCDACGGACCRFVVVAVGAMNADQRRWAEMRGPVDFAHKGAFLWRLPVACPNLARDGRCRIYASRPDVCRDFEAGGELCKKAREYRKGIVANIQTRGWEE